MATTARDGNVTSVIKFLEQEAADYGDSISPDFAASYRSAAAAIKRGDHAPALELLEQEERHAASKAANGQRQLARIQALRQQLKG